MRLFHQIQSPKREYFLAFLLFFAIVAVFFYPVFTKRYIPFPGDLLVGQYEPYRSYSFLGFAPGAVPHKAQGPDVIRQLFPLKFFTIEQLKSVSIHLWNPYTFSGNPHLAAMQAGTFYPINLIFMLTPFLFAWSLYILLAPILAGFFTYIFLREIKIVKSASVFGAIAFAFSAFMVVWIEYGNLGHTFLWLPLVLWLILRILKSPNVFKIIFLSIILSLSILAGYIQLTIYIYVLSLFFILFRFFREKDRFHVWKTYTGLFIAFITPFFITAVQLLPTIELLSQSARTPYNFDQLSQRLIPLVNIVTTIVPDFFGNPATRNYWLSGTYIERASYIGILPFLFVLFSYFKRKSPYTIFFAAAALISYISALDIYSIKLIHSLGIPILSTTVPSRALSIYCFSAAVLAGIGFDSWQRDQEKRKYFKPLFLLVAVFILLWVFTLITSDTNFLVTKKNLVLPSFLLLFSGLLIFLSRFFAQRLVILAIFLLTIFDLFYFFQKITPFAPVTFVYPKTEILEELSRVQGIDRSWGYGSGYIDANFPLYEKVFSTDGYEALFIKRYGEFISASKDGKTVSVIPRSDVNIAPGFGSSDLETNYYRQKILNILGVKYLLNKNDSLKGSDLQPDLITFNQNKYNLIWQAAPWQIYENLQVAPRIFLTADYVVIKEKDKMFQTFFSKDFDERETLILDEDPHIEQRKQLKGSVNLITYKPMEIVVDTTSQIDGLLFLSDNYYSGWKATIDNTVSKIYRADYTFRAVVVPKGEHRVIFRYEPDSFRKGSLISGLSIVLVLFVTLIFLKKGAYEIFKK